MIEIIYYALVNIYGTKVSKWKHFMHNIKEYSEQEVAHTKCLNLFQGLITKKKFKEIEMIN